MDEVIETLGGINAQASELQDSVDPLFVVALALRVR